MSFAADIEAFAKKTGQRKEQTAIAIFFKLNELVIKRTPVDTGRARGGWVASANSPSPVIGDPDKSGARAISRANAAAMMAIGGMYYLVNNVKYITILEFGGYPVTEEEGGKTQGGFSRQAPKGMIRISIEELKEFVRGYSV